MKLCKTGILFLILISLITGCQGPEAAPVQEQDKQIDITMLGGSPAGLYFMITNGISECVNASYPGSIVQITPGVSMTNPIRISKHEADTGMMADATVLAAINGIEPYDENFDNLVAIAGFYSSTFQMAVSKDLGIESFDEIIENKLKVRLSIGQPGSVANHIFEYILSEYGLTIEDMESWGSQIVRKANEESASMMSDRLIDGYCLTNLVPSHHIIESSMNTDLLMLNIDPQIIKNYADKFGYSVTTVPKGSFDFQSSDYVTVSTRSILGTTTQLSEETAYIITKSIVENIDNMKNIHAALKDLTPESLSHGFKTTLHPGALKYYKEIGVIN